VVIVRSRRAQILDTPLLSFFLPLFSIHPSSSEFPLFPPEVEKAPCLKRAMGGVVIHLLLSPPPPVFGFRHGRFVSGIAWNRQSCFSFFFSLFRVLSLFGADRRRSSPLGIGRLRDSMAFCLRIALESPLEIRHLPCWFRPFLGLIAVEAHDGSSRAEFSVGTMATPSAPFPYLFSFFFSLFFFPLCSQRCISEWPPRRTVALSLPRMKTAGPIRIPCVRSPSLPPLAVSSTPLYISIFFPLRLVIRRNTAAMPLSA